MSVLPPKGYTKIKGDEIEKRINDYFDYCIETNRKPNKHGLAVFFDIDITTLDAWEKNEEKLYDERISKAIKKAVTKMSDFLQQRTDAMAIISMKQACYGGFIDKPVNQASEIPIKITISGIDADTAAG